MLCRPYRHNDYHILRIFQNRFSEADAAALASQVAEYLDRGITRIALAFGENVYPYSKLIAMVVRCHRLVNEKGGSLALIQPSESFGRIAGLLNLPSVVRIVTSEDEL